jgi:predicted nucleic acid-binding protein
VIVVADAGPIHYLILIQAVDILPTLYGTVLVPKTVSEELITESTPMVVRSWMEQPPEWCQIHPDPPALKNDDALDPGERAAIAVALIVKADRLLIDDWEGRVEALRQGLKVTGTLGVLAEAHKRQLLDFESALSSLSRTSFYLSADLVDRVRRFLKEQS